VGAAAIGGSATKTVSTVVITFEMLGQVGPLMIPVSIGLLVAYWCTTGVGMGLFDVIIEFKNFPYMPTLGSLEAYSLKASDIMNKNFMYLSKKSTLSDIPAILSKTGEASVTIPVVESQQKKILHYTVTSASLKKYLYDHYRRIMNVMDTKVSTDVGQYLYSLHAVCTNKNPPVPKKDISVDPLIHQIYEDLYELGEVHKEIVENFWNAPIDFEDPRIVRNQSPFLVMLDTPMSKIHFLFTMLNINMLLVLKKGVIKGMITKLEFIQKRRSNGIVSAIEAKERRKQEHEEKMEQRAVEMARVILKNRKVYHL